MTLFTLLNFDFALGSGDAGASAGDSAKNMTTLGCG